jgi:hypothetical protein
MHIQIKSDKEDFQMDFYMSDESVIMKVTQKGGMSMTHDWIDFIVTFAPFKILDYEVFLEKLRKIPGLYINKEQVHDYGNDE